MTRECTCTPEVETLKQIAELRAELRTLTGPDEYQKLARRISEIEAVHNLKMERARAR
jgi:hypothetical protein